MNIKDFSEGLVILTKYFDNKAGFHLGADHDVIYVYATDHPVSDEDFNKLLDLGWVQSQCEYDGDGKRIYDHTDTWCANV